MKKDLNIPKVTNVYIAAIKEFNEEFQCNDWNAYIINKKTTPLEMVLIVSKGFDESTLSETAILRHKIEKLPPNSFAKIELLQPEVFQLNNVFNVTFFENNKLFDKKFTFKKGTIKDSNLRMISMLNKRGILAK